MIPTCDIITGDALLELPKLPERSVQCCVTSPPYYGLRDYGTAKWEGGDESCDHKSGRFERGGLSSKQSSNSGSSGDEATLNCPKCGAVRTDPQIGLEKTPEEYVQKIVSLGREVRRVLRDDGTFWLNLGDSYSSGGRKSYDSAVISATSGLRNSAAGGRRHTPGWAKPKDRLMIPARVAIALQADGWYLRDEIVWNKPNPMPESATDRTTKSHEFIYLLTKNERYYYDAEAIKEPYSPATLPRMNRGVSDNHKNIDGAPGQTPHTMNQPRLHSKYKGQATKDYELALAQNPSDTKRRIEESILNGNGTANKKSVWTVATAPCPDAHFATYPGDLIKPCILAGSRPGDTILDPCAGRGTTGEVAMELGRNAILIELNPKYAAMCEATICNTTPGLPL